MVFGALGAVKLNADDFCPNVGALKPALLVAGCDAGAPNGFGAAVVAGCIVGIPNGLGGAAAAACDVGMPNGFGGAAAAATAVGAIDKLGFAALAPPNVNAPVAGLLAAALKRFADGELVVTGNVENALLFGAVDAAWPPPNCIGEFVADAEKEES